MVIRARHHAKRCLAVAAQLPGASVVPSSSLSFARDLIASAKLLGMLGLLPLSITSTSKNDHHHHHNNNNNHNPTTPKIYNNNREQKRKMGYIQSYRHDKISKYQVNI